MDVKGAVYNIEQQQHTNIYCTHTRPLKPLGAYGLSNYIIPALI